MLRRPHDPSSDQPSRHATDEFARRLDDLFERWAMTNHQTVHGQDGLRSRLDALVHREQALEVANHDVTQRVLALEQRLAELELQARIPAVSAWLDRLEVPIGPLISVVLPTRNRVQLLRSAITSVQRQRYEHWELVVADDGSTDGTAALLDGLGDGRVRRVPTGGVGVCEARNRALAAATGDVIAYLDDDNDFDAGWLKAVAWAFGHRPDIDVAYGARIVDDKERVHLRPAGGLPWCHFVPFERERLERHNLIDINVLAHRAGLTQAYFDAALSTLGDWDLLLRLTRSSPPLSVPVVACYYRTSSADRLSDHATIEAETAIVLAKLAGRTLATPPPTSPPAGAPDAMPS